MLQDVVHKISMHDAQIEETKSWIPNWWLDIHRITEGGEFVRLHDASQLTWSSWSGKMPNNVEGRESCAVSMVEEGMWNAMACSIPHAFVCEWIPPPPPSTPVDNDSHCRPTTSTQEQQETAAAMTRYAMTWCDWSLSHLPLLGRDTNSNSNTCAIIGNTLLTAAEEWKQSFSATHWLLTVLLAGNLLFMVLQVLLTAITKVMLVIAYWIGWYVVDNRLRRGGSQH
jgi:hypothetical protein